MKKLILGFVLGLIAPFAAGYVFLRSGGMPVATSAPTLPLEHYIAHVAIHAAMGKEIDRPPPLAADEATLSAGARIYVRHCVMCHASPSELPGMTANGMFPRPPLLLAANSKGVTDDPAGETFWKIRNGLRMTGMPGYGGNLSDTEIWQVSLLLENAHALPAGARAILAATPADVSAP